MNGEALDRDAILSATDGGHAVFERYLSHHFPGSRIEEGQNISNPFLSQPQRTPSFNVYQGPDGVWRFKDFAHADCAGDCFELVARVSGMDARTDFPAILKRIEQDCGLPLHASNGRSKAEGNRNAYAIKPKPFSSGELEYWMQYGVEADVLNRFDVQSVAAYTATGRNGESYTVRSSAQSPMFAYPYGDIAHKLYRPFATKTGDKFRFVGSKPEGSVWGLEQLPEHCDMLLLTAGEKDVLTATAHGFHAVTLNSETARMPADVVAMLRKHTGLVLCCYDTDDTGRSAAARLWREHGLVPVALPSWIADGDGKDLSDFFKLGGTAQELQGLIAEAVANPPQMPVTVNGVVTVDPERLGTGSPFMSLDELLNSTDEEEPFLIENILPSVGIAAVAGIPDVGKSLFTRQLVLAVVTADEFLGLKVMAQHRRAIVVVTEESKGRVGSTFRRQLATIPNVPSDAIEILFANTLTTDELEELLTTRLREAPVDVVIVDSFGDVFSGRDPNSTAEMRKALKPFDAIAQDFSTAVLFVNHIGKASYRSAPDQSQVMNSAAFVQKCRSVIDLRYESASPYTVFLSITKGNSVSREIKGQAMILSFDETSLVYRFTGLYKPVNEINADPVDSERAQLRQEAINRRRDGESVRTIASALGVPRSTVNDWLQGVPKGNSLHNESSGDLSDDRTPQPDTGQ